MPSERLFKFFLTFSRKKKNNLYVFSNDIEFPMISSKSFSYTGVVGDFLQIMDIGQVLLILKRALKRILITYQRFSGIFMIQLVASIMRKTYAFIQLDQ